MNDYSLKQEALDKLISYSMYRGGKVIGSLRYGKVLTAREERLMVLSASLSCELATEELTRIGRCLIAKALSPIHTRHAVADLVMTITSINFDLQTIKRATRTRQPISDAIKQNILGHLNEAFTILVDLSESFTTYVNDKGTTLPLFGNQVFRQEVTNKIATFRQLIPVFSTVDKNKTEFTSRLADHVERKIKHIAEHADTTTWANAEIGGGSMSK